MAQKVYLMSSTTLKTPDHVYDFRRSQRNDIKA
jgi:hypothetical protein